MTRIDVDGATQYISDNFVLDGETVMLCHNVCLYAEEAMLPEEKESYLCEILDAIGFDESDIQAMRSQGIVSDV